MTESTEMRTNGVKFELNEKNFIRKELHGISKRNSS